MQSNTKSNTIVSTRIDGDETFDVTITLPRYMAFDVLNVGTAGLDLTKIHPANIAHSCLHGLGQRVPDTAAIGTTDRDGAIIPKAERTRIKYERMNDVCRFLESGTSDWSRKGERAESTPIAVEAFARANNCTLENAAERIAARAKDSGRKLAAQYRVVEQLFAAEYAAVKAERAARTTPAFDADAEIAALKGE